MEDIAELRRLASPVPRPQALCFDGPRIWLTSIATRRLYLLDGSWTVKDEWDAPGTPWGMTCIGPELRLVCGEGEDDDRNLRRFVPGRGFDLEFRIPCPEFEGSQLGWDGKTLHLNQWHRKRVLALSPAGEVLREWPVPHEICGQAIVDGAIHVVSTDDENTLDYWLTRIDPATGVTKNVAHIPFQARGLAWDGKAFWTNHREKHEIVSFASPVE
jgi:hypothetical protein